MNKKILLYLFIATAMALPVFAIDDFVLRNETTLLYNLSGTGNLNVTTGEIAEGGNFLRNIYCKLTGCAITDLSVTNLNVTGVLNASSATKIDLADDSIEEADISFTTTCGSGNRLYISGGDLACESAATTDTFWNITTSKYLYNNTGVLDVNETQLNLSVNLTVTSFDDFECSSGELIEYNGTEWVCDADDINGFVDNFVNTTGDTMTGNLIMDSASIILQNDSSNITRDGSSGIRIDASGNVEVFLSSS